MTLQPPAGRSRAVFVAALALSLSATLLPFARPAGAVSATLVISQVYGGGGNAGATYTNDYIEVFNRSDALIDTTGMSVQYGSTTGNIGPNSAQITPLSGFLPPASTCSSRKPRERAARRRSVPTSSTRRRSR